MPARQRDPVSQWWDTAARELLGRAYARPGQWVGTRVADPDPRHHRLAAVHGIDLNGPDPVDVLPGKGVNARTRWVRGFIRSLYYQHQRYHAAGGTWRAAQRTVPYGSQALKVEVGRRVRARGVIPAGRAVRVKILPGGRAANAAVRKLPDSRRYIEDDGAPGSRQATFETADYD